MRTLVVLTALLATFTTSCGGDSPPPKSPDEFDDANAAPARRSPSGPSIQAEVGALDPAKVKATFQSATDDLNRCLNEGRSDVEWLAGELRVFLRIANDGSVRYGFPMRSTFGHRPTEKCILNTLSERTWPRPQGGEEGETTQSFAIDADGRPAVDLDPNALGTPGGKLSEALQRCRADANSAGLSVTLYVDPDGKVISVGAAVDDEQGNAAIDCAVDAARSLRFKSPGSWPGKVTVRAGS